MLGVPHPDYLGSILTAKQLKDWVAFAGIEPFGGAADNHRFGIIAATVANTHRGSNSQPFTPADFFPDPGAPKISDEERELQKQKAFFAQMFGDRLKAAP